MDESTGSETLRKVILKWRWCEIDDSFDRSVLFDYKANVTSQLCVI